jgi:uncharacterized membrane protein YidH (DUF202 family)
MFDTNNQASAISARNARSDLPDKRGTPEILFKEMELLLAEKRTALSLLRTGIAAFALPLSVFSVLIATSRYYDVLSVLNILIPLLILSLALVILGGYLVVRAISQIRHYDHLVLELKTKHSMLSKLID